MTPVRWGRVRAALVSMTALAAIGALAPPSSALTADVVPPAVQLSTVCPPGFVRGPTYYLDDFNRAGIYDPENGGFYTRSVALGPDRGTIYQSGEVQVSGTGPVVLAFKARSAPTAPAGLNVAVQRQWDWFEVPLTQSWTSFHLDVTALVSGSPRRLTVTLDHTWDIEESGTLSTLDLDDVEVYGCATPPATGVRGDWVSNGRTGLIAVSGDTKLYSFPGTGRGSFLGPWVSGKGWNFVSQLASPGDLTGDRRTDLLALSGIKLFLYPGRGAGTFGSRIEIGTGWGGDVLATPGDTTGDGRPDLWSIRQNGKLYLYRFTGPTTLRLVKQVGAGWAAQKLVGIGDLNGDRRPDALGVLSDGCIRFYPGTAAAGLGTSRTLSCGWGVMNWVGSPGDLTGDGLSDLLARSTDGAMWLYRGLPGGRLSTASLVSTGWSGWRLIT